jgi:hypothetical protein
MKDYTKGVKMERSDYLRQIAEKYGIELSMAVDKLLNRMQTNYAEWTLRSLRNEEGDLSQFAAKRIGQFAEGLSISFGRNYIKIISADENQRTVNGFINVKNKSFKFGDLLMAAGWAGPATNFARGNIFDENTWTKSVRWTGIQ